MSRRIELELTSARPDGTWTWRAAGAREPKGVVDGALLPGGAKVGDVLRADADFDLDGITVTAVLPPKGARKEPERLELLGGSPGFEPVTQTLVAKSDRPAANGATTATPRAAAPARRRADVTRAGPRPRPAHRCRARRAPGPPHRAARVNDRPADPGPSARPARRGPRSPNCRCGPSPSGCAPVRTHRHEVLEHAAARTEARRRTSATRRPARRAAGDRRAERPAARRGQARGAAGRSPRPRRGAAAAPAAWRNGRTAPRALSTTSTRSTCATSGRSWWPPTILPSPATNPRRELAARLKDGLANRQDKEHQDWLADIDAALGVGRVVRALRLSSRPPKAGVRFPPELAQRLVHATAASLTPDASSDRWVAVLEALAYSPVHGAVVPAAAPAVVSDELRATVKRLAALVPEIAKLFGIEPPAPGTRAPRPARRPPSRKPDKARVPPPPKEDAKHEAEPKQDATAEATDPTQHASAPPTQDATAEATDPTQHASAPPTQNATAEATDPTQHASAPPTQDATAEATEPEAAEPEAAEPEAAEPEAAEPEATEPEATEPEAAEPEATEPEATEPAAARARSRRARSRRRPEPCRRPRAGCGAGGRTGRLNPYGSRGMSADERSARPRNSPVSSSSSHPAPQARHRHESRRTDAR